MKQGLLLLILMVSVSALCAQVSYYQQQIDSTKIQLAYNPLDQTQRLALAYLYMMNNQPELALPEYQQVRKLDPDSRDAAAGMLWALNSLQRWSETVEEAKSILHSSAPQDEVTDPQETEHKGLILNHLANAQAALHKTLSARRSYSRALALINPELKNLSRTGLAWAYLGLDDYPKANKHYNQIQNPTKENIFKPLLQLETSLAFKDSSGTILSLGASYKQRSLTYRIKAEEILISGAHFRWNLQGSLRKQLPYLDVRLGLQYLDGDDQRIYPGKAASLTLSPRIYLGKLGIKAQMSQHLAVYERFNVYQSDLGLELKTDPITISATVSKVYQDNEALDSDTEDWVISANASSRIYRSLYLGVYAGWGDLAWHTSPYGEITDDFSPSESYYGLSLSLPVYKKLSAMFYEQLGINEDKINPLSLLRLVYAI